MSLNRQEKAIVIEEVTTQVAAAQSIVVAEYRGLDVASVTVLRKTARESGVYLRVLKNSLARRAISGRKAYRSADLWYQLRSGRRCKSVICIFENQR